MMENLQKGSRAQPNPNQNYQPSTDRQSNPEYSHQQQKQKQFKHYAKKDDEKKNHNRQRRYSKNRNLNHRSNDLSDGSVSTNSSGDGSTNSRNNFRLPSKNWNNGKNKKDKANRRSRSHYSPRISHNNSLALNAYLRERGWSLSSGLNFNHKHNHNRHDRINTSATNTSGNNNTTVLRESEIVRKNALRLMETTLCRWATMMEKNPSAWQRARVTLVTFGSYRLRAYRPDADVDLLALCPPSCTRKDFFTSLVEMMEGEAAISNIHPIASAYTPVIKFTINNIHFDMLFGRASGKANVEKLIQYQRLTPDPLVSTGTDIFQNTGARRTTSHADLVKGRGELVDKSMANDESEATTTTLLHEFTIEDSFLTAMEDDSEVRSANGVRVTQFIINSVPNPDKFRLVLCAVKEWAMLHGIYSNVLGFLGGVNWAIMVAHVCNRFPKQSPSTLLSTFFKVFATWKWPKPVMLENTQLTGTGTTAGGMNPWDPTTNPRDARHVMPIITPVFPRMNSAYNVGIPQQRRIQEELVRAAFLTQDESNWRAIYNRSDFFECHSNFLKITIRAGNNPGDFTKWLRLCESRLRLLVNALDCSEMSVWPYAQLLEQTSKPFATEATLSTNDAGCDLPEALFFIALRFAPNVESIDLKHRTSEFLINQINSWEGRKPDMDFMIHYVLQKDLPHELISKYVATKPSAYETPDPTPPAPPTSSWPNSYEKKKGENQPSNTATTTASSRRSDHPVPKDIRGPNGNDTLSVARSTYSSIARSLNSSMRSEDGTEVSFDGNEPESRPLSPLGNFITVGGPPTPQSNGCKKKEQLLEGHSNGSGNIAKQSSRQAHLYEYLTGKIDGILPITSADESDQSSTRSPIKKRPRNNSLAPSEVSE